MAFRALTLLTVLLMLPFLSGCGTDTKTTENLDASTGQSHYGGLWIDGNDNPNNRAQYLGYSGALGTSAFTFGIDCPSCHAGGDTTANSIILKQYASSGHGDVTAIPWTVPEYGTSCQRCHTSIGFVNNLVGNAAVALTTAQQTAYKSAMQVLVCSACHVENGLVTGALRASGISGGYVATWSANSITALFSFPDAGASNLCIRCHSARYAGPNITALATTTAHYLPAAATVFSGTPDQVNVTANTTSPLTPPLVNSKFTGVAYEFSGQPYVTPEPSHKNVGTPGGKGPCVGCHMNGPSGHALNVVTEDAIGNITAIANGSACLGCHGVILPTWLNDKKDGFLAAVAELDALLQGINFYFNPENGLYYKDAAFSLPIGTGSTRTEIAASTNAYYNDRADALSLDRAHLRGAAFNLWLFSYKGGDPAAYVHNSNYSKKVLFDSIDYLNGGSFPGVVTLSDPVAAAYLDGNNGTPDIVERP